MKLMLYTSLLLVCCLNNFSSSQSPNYLWSLSSGGNAYDQGNSVVVDENGNSYVTGVFNSTSISFGNITINNSGSSDVFIVKYDPNGNVIWANSIGGNGQEYYSSITLDENGNCYVSGTFNSPTLSIGGATLNNVGQGDVFIVKYNQNGNPLWAKSAGSISDENASRISVDHNGNVYVLGTFQGTSITFGGTTVYNTGALDLFILKFDSNGNSVWIRGAGSSNIDAGEDMSIDSNGNVYIVGWFFGSTITFGSSSLVNAGGSDVFIVKYNVNGDVVWAKSAGGSAGDYIHAIDVDANGNTNFVGWFQSSTIAFGNTVITNSGISEMFFVKTNTNGDVIWAKSASGGSPYGDITIDEGGNSYVIGSFSGTTINFGSLSLANTGGGNDDIFIVKYDANGNVIWAKSAGGTSSDQGRSIAVDSNQNLYIVGNYSSSSINFGGINLVNSDNSGSTSDVFVSKIERSLPTQEHCDFTYTINNMVVEFDRVNPNCTGFIWDFGNGNTSSINPNPIFTYATPGTYSACFQCGTPVSCLSCVTISVPSNGSGSTSEISEVNSKYGLTIYPNPVNDKLTILSESSIISYVQLKDASGKLIYVSTVNSSTLEIDLTDFETGVYFVDCLVGGEILREKITVTN